MKREIWKDIEGYEGLYKISTHGRVKRLKVEGSKHRKSDMIMKNLLTTIGRHTITLCKNGKYGIPKNRLIYRLVAQAFIPNPENKPQVNHIDGDPTNNHVSNLEWVTPLENITHAHKNNLMPKRIGKKGEESLLSKLTDKEVRKIRKMYESGKHTQTSLANKFNVCQYCIWCVVKGKTWKHLL